MQHMGMSKTTSMPKLLSFIDWIGLRSLLLILPNKFKPQKTLSSQSEVAIEKEMVHGLILVYL